MSSGFFGGGVASRMLVGQLIDLPFLPSPIPRGLALWDGEIHAIADYPRLFAKIGQTFKLTGDVYNEATHFRFGGGAVFRKGATYTPPAIGCAYPLDMTEAALLALGATGRLTMTNGEQTGTYTVEGALPGLREYVAVPAGYPTPPNTLDLSSGKRAFQAVLTVPTITGGAGTEAVRAALYVSGVGVGTLAGVELIAADDGTFTLVVRDATGVPSYSAAYGSNTATLTLEFNAGPSTYGVRLNGSLLPLLTDAYAPSAAMVLMQATEQGGLAAGEAGKTASIILRTNGADITGTVSPAFLDACGGDIGGGGGAGGHAFGRFGSDNSGQHVLTTAELPIAASAEGLMDPANYARTIYNVEAGGAAAGHAHTVNPTHDAVITLVRV